MVSKIFFLATWWVGYFFTVVQELFSIKFVLHAIFFFRQALAGILFSKSPTPPSRVKWSAPKHLDLRKLETIMTCRWLKTVSLFFNTNSLI